MTDNKFIVRDTDRGNERPVDSRAEAEEIKADLEELGASVEIIPPNTGENQSASADAGVEVVEHATEESPTEDNEQPQTQATDEYELPDDGPRVDEDPLVWMPDEFTDSIDGTVAINRKGFEVLAHHYDIQCSTEMVTNPVDADSDVIMRAEATDADGDTYTAYGSASTDRGDDPYLLVEMADTRAYKRAVSRATGVGMVAVEELQNEL